MAAAYLRISSDEERRHSNCVHGDVFLRWVPVYFKIINEQHQMLGSMYYNIPLFWSITRMKYEIHHWIMSDVALTYENYIAVFIETGQDLEETKPEDGKVLEGETATFCAKYTDLNKWPSFYIKLLQCVYTLQE